MDPRPARFEQAVVALALLIGFTFQIELLIPAVAVLLAISGAVGPDRAPLPRLYAGAVAEWVEPADTLVDPHTIRQTVIVQTGVLVLASLLMFVGIGGLAWFLAIVIVVTAAIDAATGTWIEARLYRRLTSGR